jgi:hypothetical protein
MERVMQSVYQINIIPSYKPSRGFQNIYTQDEELFNLLSEAWLPELDIESVPDDMKHLLVEAEYNLETDKSELYVPNGTEDWVNGTAIIDNEEIYLEMHGNNLIYNLDSIKPDYPLILLGTTEAYTE